MSATGAFDLTGPLPSGVTVLEASAGTGKTFTIAALAARFIAEGAELEQLLLVTFTRIATGELRERVRERLVWTERELSRTLAGAPLTTGDEVIRLLGDGSPEAVKLRRDRLAAAIANFDAATIETTHGFCQEVLNELGTLGDLEPDVMFVENVDDLVEEVVDDLYVRRFHRAVDVTMSRAEAGRIARIAIENPTAEVHPLAAPQSSRPAMRRRLALAARDELERRKRSLALMTFDDQLTRLRATLTGRNGDAAIARLRERYRFVLIDEFQDTDPIQWEIVDRAFGGGGVTLVLIADPKQAIYAFRGADVYAYLDAARSASARATLSVNHRSDQALLDGFDALFGGARLGHPGIAYLRVRAAPGHQQPRLRNAPLPLRVRIVDRSEDSIELTARGFASAPTTRAHIARDLAAEVVGLLRSDATIDDRSVEPGDLAVLVPTRWTAALVHGELVAAGVPAVINGAGSVFATSAAEDWARLLEALERPASPTRARAAALTPFLGWDAARIAAAGEDELEQLHRALHGWARVLRERGVAALTETIVLGEGVPGRLLSEHDGERRLTDLGHVGQLLHGAAGADRLGVSALAGWLRERVAAAAREGGADELTRRLESDAAAVQVLTIHRSKGLEFPIVYCPFLWEPGRTAKEGEPIYFHDEAGGEQRLIDVGLEGSEYRDHYGQHLREERGEDLRLAYVALTRARHQAVLWWAGSWTSGESALSRLLFAQDSEGNIDWKGHRTPSDADAFARFSEMASGAPEAVSVEWSRLGAPPFWGGGVEPSRELEVARFDRRLDLLWRRTSYSAITAAAHDALVGSEPEQAGTADEPGGPLPVASEPRRRTDQEEAAAYDFEPPLAAMAFGARVGTLVHDALQAADFSAADLTAELTAALLAAGALNTTVLGCDPDVAAAGLSLGLRTPLGGSLGALRLCEVGRGDRLNELEFELPLAGGEHPVGPVGLGQVAALLGSWLGADDPLAGYAQRLGDPTLAGALRGYLTGSIDLVVRVRDPAGRTRYGLIDYKTNWLGGADEPLSVWDYRPAALAAEMMRSHYALQALLYQVALHRYLRWRDPAYDPDTDLLGAHYLFLRGMIGDVGAGVFAWRPPAGLIVALSELLDGERAR